MGEEPSSSGLNTRRGTHLTQPEIQLFPPPRGGRKGRVAGRNKKRRKRGDSRRGREIQWAKAEGQKEGKRKKERLRRASYERRGEKNAG